MGACVSSIREEKAMSPDLSARAASMPLSPIRKLVPFADEAKERGTHVFHLNIGQPDIQTPEPMLEAIRAGLPKVVHYCHSQGHPPYIDCLVEYYRRVGIDVEKSQINVTTGGSEAIIFAFMIGLNPGDEVIIPEPFYTNYNGFAKMAGVNIVPVTTHVEEGFHLPPVEVIKQRIGAKTKAILLCNPNNPTGTVYGRQELEAVAALCKEHGLWLFTDEVYREFVYACGDYVSALNLSDMHDRVVVMDSISKRYS